MGYRSEVAYTIRFDDSDKGRQTFDIFLADAKQNELTKNVFKDSEGDEPALKINTVKRHINFYADYVKWNSDFPDVKCHEELLSLTREYIDEQGDECCVGYLFYRIGEELNDIDESWGGDYDYEWLGISRSIERDWS